MRRTPRMLLAAPLVALAPFLTACGLAGSSATTAGEPSPPSQASPGERQGTVAASVVRSRPPADPASTPQAALERFADGYTNWTYRTLARDQQQLAASATGAAREGELQAAKQTARDRPLQRGHIFNVSELVSIAPRRGERGQWVVVTRERTGGDGEYSALQPAYHVTLATVQVVSGGWAVSSWRPGL